MRLYGSAMEHAPTAYVPTAYAPLPWLLRTWRHCAADAALRTQRELVPLLRRQPGVGAELSHTTLSRYESGAVVPSAETVEAFETVLGIPPGTIAAYLPARSAASMDRTGRQALLDRSEEGLSGPDWLRLSQLLTAPVGGLTLRTAETDALVTRLVTEMSSALGPAYQFRVAALIALGRDGFTQPFVGDAVLHHLHACGYSVIGDALESLAHARHPRSAPILLETYRQVDGATLMIAAGALEQEVTIGGAPEPQFWRVLSRQLLEDLSDPAGERTDAAAVVVGQLPSGLQAELVLRLGESARRRLRDVRVQTAQIHRSSEELREQRALCDQIATGVLTAARPHRPATLAEGLVYWLRRALLDDHDPLTGALVLGASPFAHALSHYLEHTTVELPGAQLLLNTCRRSDPETLGSAYLAADLEERRRLLVPAAHNRALPHEVDIAQELASVPDGSRLRVIYAAGMSGHPGLAELDGSDANPDELQAARWWSEQASQPPL